MPWLFISGAVFAISWAFISGASLSAASIKRDHPVPEEITSAAASIFPSALSVFAMSWLFISGARRDAASERRLHRSERHGRRRRGELRQPVVDVRDVPEGTIESISLSTARISSPAVSASTSPAPLSAHKTPRPWTTFATCLAETRDNATARARADARTSGPRGGYRARSRPCRACSPRSRR